MLVSQPRIYSFVESVANVLVGLGINVLAQHFVFPLFGIHIPWSANLGIAGIFTLISIVRSYLLRRGFNLIHVKVYG